MLSIAANPRPQDPILTSSEWDVVRSVLEGCSNAAIAVRRGVSSRTVANQVASIFRKLAVRSRAELTARLARVPDV